MPKTSISLLLTIWLVATCVHANETLWKAVTENRWFDAEKIFKEDPTVNLGFAPQGEKSVEWYVLAAGRQDIFNLKRAVFGEVPLQRSACANSASPPRTEDQLVIRLPVRFKSTEYIDRGEAGEVVTVLNDPSSPRTSLRIRKQSGEIGLIPKAVLCLTSDDVMRLEALIDQYPTEVCAQLRQNEVFATALRSLFKSELYRNHQRGLDGESLRGLTPAICLCTSLMKSPSVRSFQKDLGHALKKEKDCVKFCLGADYPPEIVVILKALRSVVSSEICSIPAPQMMKSVFGVRFLSPMLVSLKQVTRAKEVQSLANCEDLNELDAIVDRILGMPIEDLRSIDAPCSSADIEGLNTIISLLMKLSKDC